MPAKLVLIDSGSGKALHIEDYFIYGEHGKILPITTPQKTHGVFKTATYTVQGTTEQITPKGGGSLELTDLIVTFEKKNLSVVTINFHDGTNTAPIIKSTLTDSPVNLAISFNGRWQGWKNAHVDVIISGADAIGAIAIGFLHHDELDTLSYEDWNTRR